MKIIFVVVMVILNIIMYNILKGYNFNNKLSLTFIFKTLFMIKLLDFKYNHGVKYNLVLADINDETVLGSIIEPENYKRYKKNNIFNPNFERIKNKKYVYIIVDTRKHLNHIDELASYKLLISHTFMYQLKHVYKHVNIIYGFNNAIL